MMIVDFGGGTLDVSIVDCFENIIEITAIAGDNRLGGNDIDHAIVAHFCKENGLVEERLAPSLRASLYRQAETAKIALSDVQETVITISRKTHNTALFSPMRFCASSASRFFRKCGRSSRGL